MDDVNEFYIPKHKQFGLRIIPLKELPKEDKK